MPRIKFPGNVFLSSPEPVAHLTAARMMALALTGAKITSWGDYCPVTILIKPHQSALQGGILAFVFGVTDDGGSPPVATPSRFSECGGCPIPVPSSLYSDNPHEQFPQRGKRVAVKDVYHMAGTATSASSRDYQSFSGLAKQTSVMVLGLIEAGAVIVDKTKTAQFASGEHARDWVDCLCPFNPRGDGYVEPGGSSTGSAVSVAAFDWLDYGIGTIHVLASGMPRDLWHSPNSWHPRPWRNITSIVTKKRDLGFRDLWNKKMKDALENRPPITEYLATTLTHIQLFDSFHNNLPFREAFRAANGRELYANPMVRFEWDLGSRLTSEEYDTTRQQLEVYRSFAREHIFSDHHQSTVLVLPAGSPEVRYRDACDPGFSFQGFGFLRNFYSFLSSLPQVVIPIGSLSRFSTMTKGVVEEPISVSLVGLEGSDCALMELAEKVLRKSGRPLEVRTGACLF
ncbi:amidase signature domain-containing protein [Podospora didyma]|uniref:Amidase signature domain-containing protein n=1 Tax=Podospora didyma TaxID=330526 RepID=A0AAE0K1B8_9PEZI|nr:amidase signature domain-containing protein [Podospora didyma]